MDVQELIEKFPEIPADLRGESILSRFAEVFGELLQVASNPSESSTRNNAGNHYYLKLIGPMSMYSYGLCTRARVLIQLRELLDRYEADPKGFAASLRAKDAPQSDTDTDDESDDDTGDAAESS